MIIDEGKEEDVLHYAADNLRDVCEGIVARGCAQGFQVSQRVFHRHSCHCSWSRRIPRLEVYVLMPLYFQGT